MYQFTTTNVINSQYVKDYEGNDLLDSAGAQIATVVGSAAGLSFPKIGFFKKANIVSIYKRPYAAGVKEIAQITIPTIASGLVARLEVVIKLEQSTQSEYTNYSLDFQKPIVVEVIATGTAATDATALIAQLNTLKNRFGHRYFTAALSTADIVITCSQNEMRVKSMIISKSAASYNSVIQPEYEDVSSTTFSVTTPGKIGFGDNNWMMRQVMLPTAENVRAFGISKNERPILGGNYSQYVLRYSVLKDGQDGTVSGATSVTTHVFWVISTEVSRFETAIVAVGLTVPAMLTAAASNGAGLAALSPRYLDSTLDQTDQIVWSGGIGTVTFASDQETRATVSSTGLVTTADVSAVGAVIITATDALGNTDTVYYTIYDTLVATAADGSGTTPATAVSLDTSDNATNQIAVTGGAGTITYSSNEPSVADVSSSGLVTTANDAGTGNVTITVTDAAGNVDYVYYTVIA